MTTKAVLVADIGSTFTKARAYGPGGELVWSDQVPTGAPDPADALRTRAAAAGVEIPDSIPACSSAAGGLRIVALGLTQTFTREAARTAALGAGGRIVGDYSTPLIESDLADLVRRRADIVLLTGGSDGGDTGAAVGFAESLASVRPHRLTVVVACNRQVAHRCAKIVVAAGHRAEIVGNIMPEVGTLDAEPVRAAIRRIFLDTVIGRVPGGRAGDFDIRVPTPAAVLRSATLLARVDGDRGVVVVDVGGATTDVHSVIPPGQVVQTSSALMTEAAVRTVEADLGMCESARATAAAARRAAATDLPDPPDGAEERLALRARDVTSVEPDDPIERWLAETCARLAVRRHVGRMVLVPSPSGGTEPMVTGRDLREVGRVVATGGVLSRDDGTALTHAVRGSPDLLLPARAVVSADVGYELASLGVLAVLDDSLATKAMTRLVDGWNGPG